MKIEQNPKFQPITITLETKEEAEALYKAVCYLAESGLTSDVKNISRHLSSWFTTEAHL